MVICVTPPNTEFCGSKINMKLEVCTDSIGCIGVMDVQCLTITCCWYDFICWIHRSLQRVEDVRHLGGMWSNHQRGVACFGVRRGGFHVRRCLIPNKSWANLFIRETLGWDWDRFLVFWEVPQKTQGWWIVTWVDGLALILVTIPRRYGSSFYRIKFFSGKQIEDFDSGGIKMITRWYLHFPF